MELHNTVEDIVQQRADEIFKTLEKDNPDNFCICEQCRIDTICYTLNRTQPRYIVSHRGAARVNQESQQDVDISVLIYEGLRRVNHNQRQNISHNGQAETAARDQAVFNIPTIIGRLFNGKNFAPVSGLKVELLMDDAIVAMKDEKWQNPYSLVSYTDGTYTFWPLSITAEQAETHKVFEYSIRVESAEFETLNHVFKIPVISEDVTANSFSLGRTFKLPDLFLFPKGEKENNLYLD